MITTPIHTREPRGRRYLFFLLYVAALGAFGSLVNDMYLPTLPDMMREFDTSPSMVQLSLTSVMLGLGTGGLFWGPVSDRYGRKSVLIASLMLFCAATAVSLFSDNIYFFLWSRLFQGFGAGGAMILSRSIPADLYTGRDLAGIMALVGAVNGLAPAFGPMFGGLMADDCGWRGIFMVLLATGIGMLIASRWTKESLPFRRRVRRDLWSSFRNYRLLLRNRKFMFAVAVKCAVSGVLFAYISSAPFVIQDHYGYSCLSFGLVFGLNAVAIAAGSVVSVKFRNVKAAMLAGTCGLLLFAVAESVAICCVDSFWVYESLVVLMLFFVGLNFSSSNTIAMETGACDVGAASAMLSAVGYAFGGIVAPLVGLGDNMLHSSSVAFICCAFVAVVLVVMDRHRARHS